MLNLANALEFNTVTRRFPARSIGDASFTAIENLTFALRPSEFVSIVGPSGCGKSTILNLVAGLDRPTEGSLSLNGHQVDGPSSHVGFMLQKDLLLPWRNIQKNVEFGLEARGIAQADRAARDEVADGLSSRVLQARTGETRMAAVTHLKASTKWTSRFASKRSDARCPAQSAGSMQPDKHLRV